MGDVQIVEVIGDLPRFRGFERRKSYPREQVGGVERDLYLKVRSPDVTPGENTRDVMLEADDAEAMLDETRSPEAVCGRLQRALGRLRSGEVDPVELVIEQRTSKTADEYDGSSMRRSCCGRPRAPCRR